MGTVDSFFSALGIHHVTTRHCRIVESFIIDGRTDEHSVRGLLDDLGGWDDDDLRKAMAWANP